MKKERKPFDNTQGKVAILGAKRTPIGIFGGAFKSYSAVDLGIAVVSGLLKETGISKEEIKKVYLGNVISAGLGQNIARQIVYKSGIECLAVSVNKVCGSGMEAIHLGIKDILLGEVDLALCGGTENMSMAPYLLENTRWGQRLGNGILVDAMERDGLTDAFSNSGMLKIADAAVLKFLGNLLKNTDVKFLRDIQNEWAHLSYQRAIKARNEGKFSKEIAGIIIKDAIVKDDEGPSKYRPEKLDKLLPVGGALTITAGNASQISDGAAVLLLSSLEYAEKNNLKPIAVITGWDALAGDPDIFPLLPTMLLEKFFEENNVSHEQIDLFELNEAFALVPVYAEKKLGISKEKINIHGGAIAMGHPLGASGARIVVTLIHALKEYGKKRGLAAICIGGGESLMLAVEIV